MDYREYTAEDFALDKKFQQWVLEGDSTASDFWISWMKENPGKEAEIQAARELVKLSGLSIDEQANESYLKIWTNLSEKANRDLAIKRRRKYTRAAAIFTGFIAVTAYLLVSRQDQTIQYQTTFGETQKISLPDGSTVMLNANSTLRVEDDLKEARDRVVFLEGEAFFEVTKTKDKNGFQVNTGDGVTIQVLGTVFNVDARRGKSTEVFLQEGKVKVNRGEENVTLNPGEIAQIAAGDKFLVSKAEIEKQNYRLGWMSGNFVFNDTPLSEIVYDLRDDYGLDIVVTDSALNQKRITAKVSGRDVNVLFKVLSETLDIKINQEGARVVISPD